MPGARGGPQLEHGERLEARGARSGSAIRLPPLGPTAGWASGSALFGRPLSKRNQQPKGAYTARRSSRLRQPGSDRLRAVNSAPRAGSRQAPPAPTPPGPAPGALRLAAGLQPLRRGRAGRGRRRGCPPLRAAPASGLGAAPVRLPRSPSRRPGVRDLREPRVELGLGPCLWPPPQRSSPPGLGPARP